MSHKMIKKRLTLYLAVAFAFTWIPTILFIIKGGEYESGMMDFILTYSMLCPTFAVLITRFITKEGYGTQGKEFLRLSLDMSQGKWKWYLFSILIPFVYLDLGKAVIYLIFPETFNPEMLEVYEITRSTLWMYPIVGITSAIMVSIGALGEEIGWRGYMMPMLEELWGVKKSVIIGGIIWGIWHFPANFAGHNFGIGYYGEPWSGFLVFTIYTVFMGILLTFVTRKTGSVWPAAFMHAVNNTGLNILSAFYDSDKLQGVWKEPTIRMLLQMIPVVILGAWLLIMMSREENMEKKM